jgi:DNA polymerase
MDFETYSDAGYIFDGKKWHSAAGKGSPTKGIHLVGAAVYSEHSSTDVISLAYDLRDGKGERLWVPGPWLPTDLFDHIASGGLIEAHNSGFEWLIWNNVCTKKLGWPPLPLGQMRCSSAKCASYSIPASLGKAGPALGVPVEKMAEGKRLITKLSCPHTPTKNKPHLRVMPEHAPEDYAKFLEYNVGDIITEGQVSARCPDLSPDELELWQLDQRINMLGCTADTASLTECQRLIDAAMARGTADALRITGGAVTSLNSTKQLPEWLRSVGVDLPNMQADTVKEALTRTDLPAGVRRVLELRCSLGAASVKKVVAMLRYTCEDGRMRGLLQYCGADRTGRFAGRGPQPQNLPNSGPGVSQCPQCGVYAGAQHTGALCTCGAAFEAAEWSYEVAEAFLPSVHGVPLEDVEHRWGDAVACISGSLRSMFVAAPAHDFISSDYSAIEAVVLAFLAGEQWRMDVFRTHGKIYEMSAAKITGVSFDDMMDYKRRTGNHHPSRKKIGKVAELASGYQGGLGAWKQFGADKHMNDEEIKANIKAWRNESPMIREFWYAMERNAHAAVQSPGVRHHYRDVGFLMIPETDVLHIILPSGRRLNYHHPRLSPVVKFGRQQMELSFMGTHPDKPYMKWVRITTYGGKLTENVTQAVARDILTHALVKLDKAGYMPILQIHDEVVCEVPEGTGSVEELEAIMGDMPEWCRDWPVKAAGGWRGKRYRKD